MKFFTVLALLAASYTAYAQPKIGEKVPEIRLKDVNDSAISLSQYKGKYVLIDFWASWCGPCRQANRSMVSFYNRQKKNGFEVYSISIDENKDDWKRAIKADRMPWTHVLDAGGWESSLAKAWKIEMIPASFLLGPDGAVVAVDPSPRAIEKYIHAKKE